ncbi:DUF647-domain-containing protein [Hymenopellis radicata]|nr:DUF647-domain-containing protein [Hymenopellis radicata]
MKWQERDDTGCLYQVEISSTEVKKSTTTNNNSTPRVPLVDLFAKVFLPAGYPDTVTPGQYQIFNALQAFCNSLASLLSSRAVLEGFGVGDANASATNALLITVLQDVFSRLTTIISAYFVGTSLVPESKTYRLLADILNDAATILDTLTPHVPTFRVPMLCLSASLRSLCGIAAGGSKAAIAVHFARNGDLGDLNAKDASKETVLGLAGMLIGTWVIPQITTPTATYTLLAILVSTHILLNYVGIRGLALRTLNRQRATRLWDGFITSGHKIVHSPEDISSVENLFYWHEDRVIFAVNGIPDRRALNITHEEKYLLCVDHTDTVHIVLKEGHGPVDHLKAWVHASGGELDHFESFIEALEKKGWVVGEGGLVTRLPRRVVVDGNHKKEE